MRISNSTPALSKEHLLAIIVAGMMALGAYLRFARLGAPQLSRDEGSSWAGAIAPTIAQVVAQAHRIDPGKLALYDIALHGWICIFGDTSYAMRSMSAALGIISIVLLFLVVGRFYSLLCDDSESDGSALAGAFAAILIATNLAIVVHDRTARMYPMAVSASLGQMFFFAGLHRRGALIDYLGAAFLTALALGSNFTALALPAAEGIWLITLAFAARFDARAAGLSILRQWPGRVSGEVAPNWHARSSQPCLDFARRGPSRTRHRSRLGAFHDWLAARVRLVEDGPAALVLLHFDEGIGRVLLVRGRSLLISPVYPAMEEAGEPLDGLFAVDRVNLGRDAYFLCRGQLVHRHISDHL